ncbi:glycosyltransferase family 4 protein [Candidatus Borrarchaeum sp.]|uniref:glycosyltransferase family 4 protein n=1 Tax=Candidatus Borrarchaeum sp. TaxID=2846742 RepID=UPI00257CC44F|nr:glycosyltransferase family 4 protein [Candidatus Borrarchaeum sp.]
MSAYYGEYRGQNMKIAFFVWEFPPKIVGGLGTYALEITQQFIKRGHEVTVFTLNDPSGKLLTRDIWRGVEVYRPTPIDFSGLFPTFVDTELREWGLGLRFFSDVITYNVFSAAKLCSHLVKKERREFDILSAHDWLSVLGGISSKRHLDLPLIFHVHSTERGRALGGGSCTVENFEAKGAEVSDGIITVSKVMREELISVGFPVHKINVIWNGVDPENKYNPKNIPEESILTIRERYGIQDDEFMIFYVGRLIAVKGVDCLIRAMPQVLADVPNAKLVIVGMGNLYQYLEDTVSQLNLQDKVIFRNEFISEEERILSIAASDVCVFPSHYEPFGIVSLEAMAMKKPVVVGAMGTSGFKEQVIEAGTDQCGYLIDPNDPNDIANAVTTILQDPDRAKKMGENARKRVLAEFTWDHVAENTISVYERFL